MTITDGERSKRASVSPTEGQNILQRALDAAHACEHRGRSVRPRRHASRRHASFSGAGEFRAVRHRVALERNRSALCSVHTKRPHKQLQQLVSPATTEVKRPRSAPCTGHAGTAERGNDPFATRMANKDDLDRDIARVVAKFERKGADGQSTNAKPRRLSVPANTLSESIGKLEAHMTGATKEQRSDTMNAYMALPKRRRSF